MRCGLAFSMCLSLTVLTIGGPAVAGQVGVSNWYEVEIWKFPDPAQDSSNLPSNPAHITYNQNYVSGSLVDESFDLTFSGDAPRSGAVGPSQYSIRVAANSDFTHLRASYETTLTDFLASNWRPGFYDDGTGATVDGNPGTRGYVATLVDELLTVTGPGGGTYGLTYVLNVSGSASSAMTINSDYVASTTSGAIKAYGSDLYGDYIELPKNGSFNQTVFLTVQGNLNAPTFTRLAMDFQNYMQEPGYTLTDEQAAETFLSGSILWNYETTAEIAKLIIELPVGADPADYSFAAESNTPYNVEFRVADVPMPGDYNQNGVVDAADYIVWRNGLGTTYTPAGYDTWRANFGRIAGAESLSDVTVPEPANWMLLIFAATLFGWKWHQPGRVHFTP